MTLAYQNACQRAKQPAGRAGIWTFFLSPTSISSATPPFDARATRGVTLSSASIESVQNFTPRRSFPILTCCCLRATEVQEAMPILSMNELTTYRWTFEQDVLNYVDSGYRAIGVWRPKLADYGIQRGIELLHETGLAVSNLMWTGGFTGSEAYSYEESLADAESALELARAIDAGCLVIHPGGRNNHTFRHAERLFRSALDHLLLLAEASGVTLAIEPMHPACASQCTFLCDVESALAVIEDYNSPLLKMVFDTYHFGNDEAVLANLGELAPHIAVVHLGDLSAPHDIDESRCLLGGGSVPLEEIVSQLREEGFDGYFDVELIGSELEIADYGETLRRSREFFTQITAPVAGR